jgi:hypothetical protein
MAKATRVHSTPPTNTSLTRRNMLGAITAAAASLPIAAAIPTTLAAAPAVDPIFAAIDAFHRADAAVNAAEGDIPDELGDQCHEAYLAVVRTRPITPAGLAALTSWVRERTDWLSANSTHLPGEELCAIAAAVDDATRGMSGLEPWSPPPTAVVVSTPLGQHPDAELFAAIERYYEAVRKYDVRLRTFGKVEFIEPRPRGYVSKERAYLRSMKHYGRVEREVAAIRAKTLEGLIAKATAANNEFCPSEDIQLSVAEDVLVMQPGRGKAVV